MVIKYYIAFCLLWTVYTTIKHVRQPNYDNRKLWYTVLLNLVVSPICVGLVIYNYVIDKYKEYRNGQKIRK